LIGKRLKANSPPQEILGESALSNGIVRSPIELQNESRSESQYPSTPEDLFNEAINLLRSDEKLESHHRSPQKVLPLNPKSDSEEISDWVARGRQALEWGQSLEAGRFFFQAIERGLQLSSLSHEVLGMALEAATEPRSAACLPPGALYIWAQRVEQRQWWAWAIALYDSAARESPSASNSHSRRTSRLRAALLRMDHRIEPTRARQDLTEMANGPADDLVTCKQRA
jgi:hypothetical protein